MPAAEKGILIKNGAEAIWRKKGKGNGEKRKKGNARRRLGGQALTSAAMRRDGRIGQGLSAIAASKGCYTEAPFPAL